MYSAQLHVLMLPVAEIRLCLRDKGGACTENALSAAYPRRSSIHSHGVSTGNHRERQQTGAATEQAAH